MVSYQWKIHLHLADNSPADTKIVLPMDGELHVSVENTSAPCRLLSSRHSYQIPPGGLLVISGKYSTSSPCRQFLSIHWSSPPSGWWVISGKYICTLQTNLQQILRYSSRRTVSYQWKVHLHLADFSPSDTKTVLPVDGELSVERTSAPCRLLSSRHCSSPPSGWWVISGKNICTL